MRSDADGSDAMTDVDATPSEHRPPHATGIAEGPLPERAEVLPGIWRLPLPLRGNPLGHVNTYLVRSDDGYLLVDCGWDTADTLKMLEQHLRVLDVRFNDIRHLVVTHIHPDHYGLAGRLREISNADLKFHRLERLYIESRYADADGLLEEMREWLRLHGTPQSELDQLNRGSMKIMERVQLAFPDETLEDGEEIACGRFSFRVLWTPGHSAGHICLFDPLHKVLLSGDHVLPRISPSISLHSQSAGNPLADYLDSLRLVAELQAELVLPGHGDPFTGLAERTAELLAHHQARLAEILELLERDRPRAQTAYELTRRMRWAGQRTWDDLGDFEQRLAVTEAIAHLEVLHARGHVLKRFSRGTVSYGLPADPTQSRGG